ncbi:MAG: Hsp20/alpha crystallin family protein [Burkholderiales bacterium]
MNPRDLHTWMWGEALSMLEQADRLRRQFFRMESHTWEPPADVIETARDVVVHVALPGVAAKDVAVGLEPELLTVSALRAFPACERGARIHRLEIPYGRFERRITLPIHALELADRTLANGCLTLTFRKKESA